VSVFSAGNEGLAAAPANRLSHGMATVTSPATSKNCIAAGATNAAGQPAGAAGAGAAYAVFLVSVSQPVDGGLQIVESYRVRPGPARISLSVCSHMLREAPERSSGALPARAACCTPEAAPAARANMAAGVDPARSRLLCGLEGWAPRGAGVGGGPNPIP